MGSVFESLMKPQPVLSLEIRDGAVVASGQQVYEHSSPVPGGPFLKWSWDGATLTASNDRFGLLPCFFAETESGFCISTSIRDLIEAGVPAELDYDALSVMLYFGQFVGDSTPFAGVKSLPANARLDWSRDGLKLKGGASIVKPDPLPRDQAIDAFIDLFSQSMRRHLERTETFVVPLTGGRDSRHILFEAIKQGRQPEAVLTAEHFPMRRNDDILVAKRVCDELGVTHRALPTVGSYVDAETAKLAPLEWMSMEHVFSLPVLAHIANLPGRALYDGLAGGLFSAGAFLDEHNTAHFESGRIEELARGMCSGAATLRLLSPEAQKLMNPARATEQFIEELKRHQGSANPMSSYFFWNRTRRNISLAPYRLMGRFLWPICTPYVSDDIFDLMMSQPSAQFMDRKFHDDAIARAYPQWAHLPFEVKGPHYEAPRAFTRSTAVALARFGPLRKTSLLNRSQLAMRLARSILLPGSGRIWWLRPALYLASLEGFVRRRAG